MTLNMYSSVTLLRHGQFDIDNPVTTYSFRDYNKTIRTAINVFFFFVFTADVKQIFTHRVELIFSRLYYWL